VAGFAAFKDHLSYFPHSGSALPELAEELDRYSASKGTLQFPVDKPLPKALVKKLIAVRRRRLGGSEPTHHLTSPGGPTGADHVPR
jgi:uncharacterized protein YdhG (YjbR/CyaY superfamily)